MKKSTLIFSLALLTGASCITSCHKTQTKNNEINYNVEKFYDLEVLRYDVPDFDELSLQQKKLVYFLTEAALQGRDILYDQNCMYNLAIRRTLESIYVNYPDKQDEQFLLMEKYLKRVWFSNGIHHHYSEHKFLPEFSREWFADALKYIPEEDRLRIQGDKRVCGTEHDGVSGIFSPIVFVMFDPDYMSKKVNQTAGEDLLLTSACNYYQGLSQAEAEAWYAAHKDTSDEPMWVGLNAQLVKNGEGDIIERTYKVGGLYSEALERVVYWLKQAREVAETEEQRLVIDKLIEYNTTGNLRTFNEYAIAWVKDLDSRVDFINGFTEVYGDPLGITGAWEAMVNFKNIEATKRTEVLAANAQWFEDNSPTAKEYKKETVKGVSAKVINAAILGGDCYPSTPIGINLPNANWIRKEYGSKSVTIQNITDAYDKAAQGNGFNEEFMLSDKEIEMVRMYGALDDNCHTDLHECLGHGSGKLLQGVTKDDLKEHGSTIEEARADLFGLYYIADPKMVELGIMPNAEAYKAEYYRQMMNGAMTQLVRIEPGKDIEEAHMRNRQLIAGWVLDHVTPDAPEVEIIEQDGKHYMRVNDYEGLRRLYGELLAIIQDITSTGNYAAAKEIVEQYAVHVDKKLHEEMLERYKKLNLAPYKGFVNPVYTPVTDKDGNITDIQLNFTEGYAEQHLRYSRDYSPLPTWN
ncbi:MAG: dihydrofolate reductase [Paludibacteraceae bacterium]|nr:dihydrofolate reductase [Paludibacteraceae bacterium]